jgi:hypothetical protein
MLPDWPVAKSDLVRAGMRRMAADLRQRTFGSFLTPAPVFEGDRFAILRADGNYEEKPFSSAGAEVKIPVDAIKSESLPEVFARMKPVVEEIARSQQQTMSQVIEEGVRSVGNEINAGGKPISAELILDVLDKVFVDFDENNNPIAPTIVFHPSQTERWYAEWGRIQTEPELTQRYQAIMQKKWIEYRGREADRILVG